MEEKAWGISSRDAWHGRHYVVTSPVNRQVMYETNLAFCACYEGGTSASGELH